MDSCKIIAFEDGALASGLPEANIDDLLSNNIRLDGIDRRSINKAKYEEIKKVIASPVIKEFLDSRAGKDLIDVAEELRTKFNLTDHETFYAITYWENR